MYHFTASVFALVSTLASSEAFGNDASAANRYLSQVGFAQVGPSILGSDADSAKLGFAVSLSANGDRLAIGATGHENAGGNITGAVFLYDYDGTDWVSSFSILGTSTVFPIGEFFDLSADGSRLAVRQYVASSDNPVEVYDATTGLQVGGLLSDCTAPNSKAVAVSADGDQIAVSCENWEAAGSTAKIGQVNVYQLNNGAYELHQIISGGANDQYFGWAASFDAGNGDALAISSIFYGTDRVGQVRVYNTTSWAQIGSAVTGEHHTGRFGISVALDQSGTTLVVGASSVDTDSETPSVNPAAGDQDGEVHIYWLSGTNWVTKGASVKGELSGDQFGKTVAISHSGNRIAATSGNHDAKRGEVRVFEWGGIQWNQVHEGIEGLNTADNFGAGRRNLGLSGDGYRIVSGSSGAASGTGRVRIFEQDLNFNPSSTPSASSTAPSFTPSASSAVPSTSSVAPSASSAAPSNPKPSSNPSASSAAPSASSAAPSASSAAPSASSAAPSESSAAPSASSAAPSASSAAPSNLNPTSTPSASSSAPSNLNPSSTPSTTSGVPSIYVASQVPSNSLLPSSVPSISASSSPTKTSTPSSSAESEFPTMDMGKFGWDLDAPFNVTIAFDGDSEEEEIKLSYNISLRTAIVTILDKDCNNTIGLSIVDVTHETDITSATHGALDVTLDVKQDTVVGSPIWTNGTKTGEGFIKFCVRVDLVLDDANQTSANFHEQKLLLTIGLSQGFSVMSDIDLLRDDADEEIEDVQVIFDLFSCHCNASAYCVDETLYQGDDVYICVSADPDSDVEIDSVDDLDFTQGSLSIMAINDGSEDDLTEVLYTGKTALIRSQMRSLFFLEPNPDPVSVTGQVSFIFGDVRRTLRIESLLRGSEHAPRKMQEPEDVESAGFKTTLQLLDAPAPTSPENEGTGGIGTFPLIASIFGAFAGVAIIAFAFVLRKKKDDDEEPADGEALCNDLA